MSGEVWLWLDSTTWAGISALATTATAVIAGYAARVGLGQWRDARAAQAEQERPYVMVFEDGSLGSVQLRELVLRNVGKRPAYEIRITMSPPPERARETPGHELRNARIFREPIAMLAPGQELRFFFDSMIERKDSSLPNEYEVEVSYRDSSGRRYEGEHYAVDLLSGYGLMFIDARPHKDLVNALNKIDGSLKRIVTRAGSGSASTIEPKTVSVRDLFRRFTGGA